MPVSECPKARPMYLVGRGGSGDQEYVELYDPEGLIPEKFPLPLGYGIVLSHLDGRRTVPEVQIALHQQIGQFIPSATLEAIIRTLHDMGVVEGGRTEVLRRDRQQYLDAPVRKPAHAGGAYAGTPATLRRQLAALFTGGQGAGEPRLNGGRSNGDARLRGILSPHIDLHRGGATYTWAYKELVENTDAETFVIFGVAHNGAKERFALSRKDFRTPLGTARTDQDFLDRIATHTGTKFFDEIAHRTEHSIEFQVLFLQYLLGERPFRIVPILVASFQDLMDRGIDPKEAPEVAEFITAVRAAETGTSAPVCYICGGDLGHIGQHFDKDDPLLDDVILQQLRHADGLLLNAAERTDPAAWFDTAARERDRWRVCGLASAYTMLHAMQAARGKLLAYAQAVDPQRICCVSFASMAFYAS